MSNRDEKRFRQTSQTNETTQRIHKETYAYGILMKSHGTAFKTKKNKPKQKKRETCDRDFYSA